MKKYLGNINWRRVGRIVLVALPVIIWDVTYFLVTKLYEGCTVVDKVGAEFLDKFIGEG